MVQICNFIGFNGMLRDDDVRDKNATYTAEEGRGNSYDFGARMNCIIVGRFSQNFLIDKSCIYFVN